MGFFYTPLHLGLNLSGMLLAALCVLQAVRHVPWKRWQEPTVFSAWCASIIVLTLLWRMRVHIQADLHLHLMGLALFTLMFGRPLSLLGISVAVLAYTAEYDGLWLNLGTNILLMAVFPSWLSATLLRLTQRYLPHHMFVYLFANGFFGALLVNGGTGLLAFGLHAVLLPEQGISADAIAYMLLLAWGEAFLVGFLVTIFAVYRPAWLFTFDDALYLKGK